MPDYDLNDLIEISRFAGERFDLVQAGGGNSSTKLEDGKMYVKASGMALSDVRGTGDFCCLEWRPLIEFLDRAPIDGDTRDLEVEADNFMSALPKSGTKRPSIETLMHAALGPLTLHTHPIAVAAVVCRSDWKEKLSQLFGDAFYIDYKTPGASLAVALRQELRRRNWQPGQSAVVFLQNHGLIVAGKNRQEVIELTEKVVDKIAASISLDLSRYKLVNFASQLVNKICQYRQNNRSEQNQQSQQHHQSQQDLQNQWIAYLSEDRCLNQAVNSDIKLLTAGCATPDQLVYCGPTGILIDSDDFDSAKRTVADFWLKFHHAPKLLILKSGAQRHLLLLGPSLRKCKEMEDVLKSHVMLQKGGLPATLQFLPESEVNYLTNWEAEKYRQNL